MNIELTRFKVKPNKSEKVDEWLQFLREHMAEIEQDLLLERMYVETIFRETWNGEEYLYWYSVQGENGLAIEENPSRVAKQHLAYWDECIDESYGAVDLKTEVVMIPSRVRNSMDY